MVECCPGTTIADLCRRKVDRVEVNIVLAHELVEMDILLVEPPLFPLRRIIGSDTRIPDASVELLDLS